MSARETSCRNEVAGCCRLGSRYRWYETQRPGLGDEFLEAASDLTRIISQDAGRFPVIHRDIRRALFRRFPYAIFYRLKANHVIVVACFHFKRDPKKWMSRR